MKSFVIVCELRGPKTAHERRLAGSCVTEDRAVSRVFLSTKQARGEMVDTFFHEMAHAYMHWRGYKNGKKAEKLALTVGRVVAKCFRGPK